MICLQDKIYMYGGVKLGGEVCRELWAFDVSAKSWENITVKAEPCLPNSTSLCGMCLVEPVSTYQDDLYSFYSLRKRTVVLPVLFYLSVLRLVVDYKPATKNCKEHQNICFKYLTVYYACAFCCPSNFSLRHNKNTILTIYRLYH